MIGRFFGTALLVFLSLSLADPSAAASRAERYREGLNDPAAVRSVYFVRGMSCRACTMLIDRKLNSEEGIYWARFNYPLRIFTVVHDPGKCVEQQILALGAVHPAGLEQDPRAFQPVHGDP